MSRTAFDRTDIDLFLALSESGNLAAAARALAVHHATAFRRLQDIEAKLDTRLFERLTGGYVLTAAGRTLVDPARRIREELRAFDGTVLQFDRAPAGTIRVTSSDGIAVGYLPPLLAAFSARHPAIQIELAVENQLSDIAAREVDIAVRPARRLAGTMVGRRVAPMGYGLYASPGYLRNHPPLDPQAPRFEGHAVIGYDAALAFFSTAQWLARHAAAATCTIRCNTLGAMVAFARTGAGIAAIPCVTGDAASGVERIGNAVPAMATHLWLCTHPHIRKVARVRLLLDYLYDAIRADAARLAGTATGARRTSDPAG